MIESDIIRDPNLILVVVGLSGLIVSLSAAFISLKRADQLHEIALIRMQKALQLLQIPARDEWELRYDLASDPKSPLASDPKSPDDIGDVWRAGLFTRDLALGSFSKSLVSSPVLGPLSDPQSRARIRKLVNEATKRDKAKKT